MFVFAGLVVLHCTGCKSAEQRIEQNRSQNSAANDDVPSGGDLIEADAYEYVAEGIDLETKTISKEIGLPPMEADGRNETLVFRLWSNFGGLGNARLLSIRTGPYESDAEFFEIYSRSDPLAAHCEKPAGPRSGWNEMRFELRNRLTTPKGLVRDPNFELQRDEPLIVLEVFDKGEYRRVFYGMNTSFADGKRLISVCEFLAIEFGVDMDCRSTA